MGDAGKVRLAVVGAGLIGARHARLIAAHPQCTLAGICDTDAERGALAAELQVPFFTSVDELLRRSRPEGAVIATPNAQHALVAEICAGHSVHVLVEKPIADSVAGGHRIAAAAGQGRVRVLAGHHRRHNARVLEARRRVRGGELGRLIGVSVLWALLKPDEYFQVAWRRRGGVGGPALINLIHDLDTLRFVCGEITQVYARTSSAVRGLEVEDTLSISLVFAGGALGTVLASDAAPAPWSYELDSGENPAYPHVDESCYHFLGTGASLAFPALELWRYPDPECAGWHCALERSRIPVHDADPLKAQLEHFCRVIRQDEDPVVDAEDATRSLAVVAAVHRSARTGVPVDPETLLDPAEGRGA